MNGMPRSLLVALLALAACAAPPRGMAPGAAKGTGLNGPSAAPPSPPSGAAPSAPAAAAPPAHAAAPLPGPQPVPDASYDWHGLLPVPFGTGLHESGLRLKEVLLFRDRAQAAEADSPAEGDCFTLDSPPRLVGREPYEYLLCFEHDRLQRIDTAVRLDAAEADQVFARACALWLKSGAPVAGTRDRCEGGDERIVFRARLESAGEESRSLAVTLLAVAGDAGPAAP